MNIFEGKKGSELAWHLIKSGKLPRLIAWVSNTSDEDARESLSATLITGVIQRGEEVYFYNKPDKPYCEFKYAVPITATLKEISNSNPNVIFQAYKQQGLNDSDLTRALLVANAKPLNVWLSDESDEQAGLLKNSAIIDNLYEETFCYSGTPENAMGYYAVPQPIEIRNVK